MRYGNAHNVHKQNKKSEFTRQPKNLSEMIGNPLRTAETGESAPILEEGYSYQGGEGMVAVGEVGVSKRYGGGRDGMHHKMESRTVYKKAPEPEKVKEDKIEAAEPEGPKGPVEPDAPVSMSPKYVEARERANLYETETASGNNNPYGQQSAESGEDDASSFLDKYKLNLDNNYDQNEDGNYVDKKDNAEYKSAMEKYEEEKKRFEAGQASLG